MIPEASIGYVIQNFISTSHTSITTQHFWSTLLLSAAADSANIHSVGHNSIPSPPPNLVYFSPPLSSVSLLLLLAFLPLARLFCGLRDGLSQSQGMPSRLDMLE